MIGAVYFGHACFGELGLAAEIVFDRATYEAPSYRTREGMSYP